MDSVMNFLADYYIWFFVAAGILCFALIGFVIESRKKQKNEFKGESIDQSTVKQDAGNNTVDTMPVAPSAVEPITPTEVIGEPVVNQATSNTSNSLEDTMEINDIPISEPDVNLETPKPAPIEFYSGPITMPIDVPKAEPIETLSEAKVINANNNINPQVTAKLGETISYEQVAPVNNGPESVSSNTFSALEENKEEKNDTNNFNMFDNMN